MCIRDRVNSSPLQSQLLLNLEEYFPFPLDSFQIDAIKAINSGNSVVLTAPTGSGKTIIGEFAIYRGLSHESRVFYTTPLKALSNQKFRDFINQFGDSKVGLLTGDISINRGAPILVMTTCLLYTSPSPRDRQKSRMPSSA